MLFSLTMFPVGHDASLIKPVAEVVDEVDRSGLHYQVNGVSTVIEGDWDQVFPVIRRAHERLRHRHRRVFWTLTVDDHPGVDDRLHEAVHDLERELHHSVTH